ncbi:zinc finger BED domain-containing protein DAYSLEEPER-like [Dioscorea cayenensis subsp. rotundata]|uniref:Zinc finger BED domain-containing protein DAYSLEEPER-like n=1 Tax=Dioscorea cayennensis subsp. rotundata TaxID=55577 RepID=A0AB40AI31_DIOCR|nr:zinc finger BED domain-containing protein DAYSLEEPER-like [Dioscorea cayenensis subsp. rotundata]
MIVLHEYPLTMVEHLGFRKFVGVIQPLFKNISRGTLKKDILKIYEHERAKTMKLFEENTNRFAITTDMWTSSNQKKGFMAIMAHYIDASWSLQGRIIRLMFIIRMEPQLIYELISVELDFVFNKLMVLDCVNGLDWLFYVTA